MEKIHVELGEKSYPVYVGVDILDRLGEMLQLYTLGKSALVISDDTVFDLYGDRLLRSLQTHCDVLHNLTIPPGEASKSLSQTEEILTSMLQDHRVDRNALLIAFGGGVVGDLTGFVASIYKRGVSYVQVPTSLMAQVDSSIGGKTGVNHALGKNLIGTFYQPRLVWSDVALLQTLPKRERLSGLGEVVKYGIIRDDELFAQLERSLESFREFEPETLQSVVARCARSKAEIVSEDETEEELRMVLNFGHTVGHAVEAASGFGKLSHGEAVLWGILAESEMASELGLLDRSSLNRINSLVREVLSERPPIAIAADEILRYMSADKKAVAAKPRFVLPCKIGDVTIVDDVQEEVVLTALRQLTAV